MLNHLLRSSPLDAAIWITIVSLQGILTAACYHGRVYEKYRALALYISFVTLLNAVVMFLPLEPGFRTFTWVSYPGTSVQYALFGVIVADLYAKALGPRVSLPDWAPRNLAILLGLAVAASVAIGIVFKPAFGVAHTLKVIGWVQVAMLSALALALWILIFYKRRLGLAWWKRDAQIAGPLVLMLTAYAIALSIIWTDKDHARLAQRCGQFVSISVYGYWSWKLWEKEPAPAKATSEMLETMLNNHRESLEAVAVAVKVLQ